MQLQLQVEGGETIEVTPEYATWWTPGIWHNFSYRKYSGHLALHKMLDDGFGDKSEVDIKLTVTSVPGPPLNAGRRFSFPVLSDLLGDEQDLRPDSQRPIDSSATPQSKSIGDLEAGLAF